MFFEQVLQKSHILLVWSVIFNKWFCELHISIQKLISVNLYTEIIISFDCAKKFMTFFCFRSRENWKFLRSKNSWLVCKFFFFWWKIRFKNFGTMLYNTVKIDLICTIIIFSKRESELNYKKTRIKMTRDTTTSANLINKIFRPRPPSPPLSRAVSNSFKARFY